jgi:predicted metal-dependent hydrolase
VGLEAGLDLMRAGRWFDAHEELEREWRDAPAAERDFLQGLVHVTVGWHHASSGNARGAAGQLAKAARRLEGSRPAHRGVDVEHVLGQVEAARARLEVGLTDLLPVRLP